VRILDLIWLPEIIDKLDRKHHVVPEEVDEVLFTNPLFRKVQIGHVSGENIYAALGRTDEGRYLVVFFVYKTAKEALIISARDMDKGERKYYEGH
jgi:uncharacterized protein